MSPRQAAGMERRAVPQKAFGATRRRYVGA